MGREDHKNQVKDLEHKETEDTPLQKQEDKRIQKVEDNVRNFWDNFKGTNTRIMGGPRRRERARHRKHTGRNSDRKIPPPGEQIRLTSPGSAQNPKQKKSTPRHIIIKFPRAKDKERILKAAREKQVVTYKGALIGMSTDFSTETMQARREWQEIFKVMNSKNLQPKILYPAKLSLRIEGQIKSFTNKTKKLKEPKPVWLNA